MPPLTGPGFWCCWLRCWALPPRPRCKTVTISIPGVLAASGVPAGQAALSLLSQAGVQGVSLEPSSRPGLSDHYDPRSRTLRLSQGVYGSSSIAALGIARP